jgi:hypothetical protein
MLRNEKASAGSGGIGGGCTTLFGCSTLIISIPDEEFDNPYVIRELHFYFHSSREETAGREGYGGAAHEEVRFALDSPLEGTGFEPSVPR